MAKNIDNTEKTNEELVEKEVEIKKEQCFVIMPIGDHPSHEKGHFTKIYRDLIKPAIEDAGFIAYRADEGGGSQNIQIDIIKKIIEAPMAVCDLSTRNPNVLFELGIRQAFDLPVALIQEVGTERIFDIQTFNTGEYRSERIYDEVMKDRGSIVNLIKNTYQKHNDGEGINSIIRLIPTVENAKLSGKSVNSDELIKMMFNQMNNLVNDISNIKRDITNRTLDEIAIDRDDIDIANKIIDILDGCSPGEKKIFKSVVKNSKSLPRAVNELAHEMGITSGEVTSSYSNTLNIIKDKGISYQDIKRLMNLGKI